MNADQILAIDGITLGGTSAAIRKRDRLDLAVLLFQKNTTVSGVFTQNSFSAAPVQICQEQLA